MARDTRELTNYRWGGGIHIMSAKKSQKAKKDIPEGKWGKTSDLWKSKSKWPTNIKIHMWGFANQSCNLYIQEIHKNQRL